MPLLYLVTESDRDAVFYRKCAERLGRRQFTDSRALRNRTGDGSEPVKKQLRYALQQARNSAAGGEEVCFIAAIDNDRSPHPENQRSLQREKLSRREQDSPARLPWMEETVTAMLGRNRAVWPMRVGMAVPVEMIESWTVKALGKDRPGGPMPHFSWRDDAGARDYYHPVKAPAQWKDLEQTARDHCDKQDDSAFYEHVVATISDDPAVLRDKSPSFALFHDQLAAW